MARRNRRCGPRAVIMTTSSTAVLSRFNQSGVTVTFPATRNQCRRRERFKDRSCGRYRRHPLGNFPHAGCRVFRCGSGLLKPIVQSMGKASNLARFIATLYVALLMSTPWLIRESTLLLPPSASVFAQATSVAASAAIEALGHTLRALL